MMLKSFLPNIEQRYVFVASAAGAILPLSFYLLSRLGSGGGSLVSWIFENPSQFTLAAMPVWSGLVALQLARARRLRLKQAAARRLKERRLMHAASHDFLTGLANRAALQRRSSVLARASRPFSILLLDLDKFKLVNDMFGHKTGDLLLQSVSARLMPLARGGVSVYRLGGDEFVILCEGSRDHQFLDQLAKDVEALIGGEFVLEGGNVTVGVSVGIACSSGVETVDAVMQRADLALYHSKDIAGSCHTFFDESLEIASQSRLEMERDLVRALENDELALEFQPIFNAENGDVKSMEALVRWRHPEKGTILPERFLPVAERCGLIAELDLWVLRNACAEAVKWPSSIGLSVKVSRSLFEEKTFLPRVVSCLDASGLSPARLTIEISETLIAFDTARVSARLKELRTLGVKVVLDDFGLGLSTLSRLGEFELDQVKLERSFVAGILNGAKGAGLMEAMLQFGSALKVETVIEGIDDLRQMEFVRERGVSGVQGQLFSEPVPAAEVTNYLNRRRNGPDRAVA